VKLRVGDTVKVVTGADIGKESKIARIFPKTGKIIVENVATAKRHTRPSQSTMQGGIIDKDMPIAASNVMIVCKKCGPTRIGYRVEGSKKVRVCRKCGAEL
jgi:large subunit ribosomal protein L24